jgi:hypothetical protein
MAVAKVGLTDGLTPTEVRLIRRNYEQLQKMSWRRAAKPAR